MHCNARQPHRPSRHERVGVGFHELKVRVVRQAQRAQPVQLTERGEEVAVGAGEVVRGRDSIHI
eukprot:scaffold9274_cov103-Isochrysis_galbana.AAC.5